LPSASDFMVPLAPLPERPLAPLPDMVAVGWFGLGWVKGRGVCVCAVRALKEGGGTALCRRRSSLSSTKRGGEWLGYWQSSAPRLFHVQAMHPRVPRRRKRPTAWSLGHVARRVCACVARKDGTLRPALD
jgi:hypothetical protein